MPSPEEKIKYFLKSGFQAIEDPLKSQTELFEQLIKRYAKTEYGRKFSADKVTGIEDFQRTFPIVTYKDLLPYFERLKEGDYQVLLSEPVLEWGMTRGTTGKSKYIPFTDTDLEERVKCGARSLLNYVWHTKRFDILQGACLNINFPSQIGSFQNKEGKSISYGYSSGIYARYNAEKARIFLVPSQQEIDELGSGLTPEDWEERFELVYRLGKEQNATMMIGVVQNILKFGRFLKKRFGRYPRDVWKLKLLICTSAPGIHYKYKPALQGMFGDAVILEIYGATEGLYAQQLDEKPFVMPNYDCYLMEVQQSKGTKLLCQMKKGEYGSLIISSVLFPRYKIGDIIKCFGRSYFRVLGREKPLAYFRYLIDRLLNL